MALAVATHVWPLLEFLALLTAAAAGWAGASGDTSQLPVAWQILSTGVFGLTASFALHESAHAAVLKRVATVTAVTVERTWGRISLIPHGHMTGWQTAAVAAAGPAACAAVGAILALPDATRTLSWWYLGHCLFLLPVFGDGIALLKGMRAGPRRIATGNLALNPPAKAPHRGRHHPQE